MLNANNAWPVAYASESIPAIWLHPPSTRCIAASNFAERRAVFSDGSQLEAILDDGAAQARVAAAETLRLARSALGLSR